MKISNFSRKQQIDSYLKALDNPAYKLDNFEDDAPNLGNVHWFKKKITLEEQRSKNKRLQYFKKLKEISKCQLCEKSFKPDSLVIDHEHSSRKIRGVLCQNCNHGLGKFTDNSELMRKAATYVESFKREEAIDYYRPFK